MIISVLLSAKRIAYEKIGFKMLFANMKEFWAGDLCADKQMQEKIVRKYNSSVVKLKKYKLYINSCSKIIPYHDYTVSFFFFLTLFFSAELGLIHLDNRARNKTTGNPRITNAFHS